MKNWVILNLVNREESCAKCAVPPAKLLIDANDIVRATSKGDITEISVYNREMGSYEGEYVNKYVRESVEEILKLLIENKS